MELFDRLLTADPVQDRERRVHGLVTARVTGIGEDGTYELDYLSMGDGQPSSPARIMTPMAGANRGMHFFPEVGDEVVVAFELGDVDRPIVLGAVWNDQSPVPSQAEQSPENNRRSIVSRSGHEVILDDTAGRQKVIIRSQGGRTITLDDTPGGKITIETPSQSKIEMDDLAGRMTIRAPTEISLQSATITLAATTIQFSGGAGVTASAASGRFVIDAPVQILLDAPNIALNTVMPAPVTGSMVVIDGKPFGAHTHGAPPTTGPVTP